MQSNWTTNSGEKTADAKILTGGGVLDGILIVTDGTNAVTITVYDNTAGSGTKLLPTMVITTSSTDRVQYIPFDPPIGCNNGIYVDITCAGTVKYNVYYRTRRDAS